MSHIKQLHLLIVLLIMPLFLHAQEVRLEGVVRDINTKHPLAFVNIIYNDGPYGTTTDIDGRFSVKFNREIDTLRLSYVGYDSQRVAITAGQSFYDIYLEPEEIELSEVQITPEMNPANRIIRKAIENRKENDPKNLNSYSYTSYDKMIFTVNQDSLAKMRSSINDTTFKNMKEFFEDQHLFLMETASEVKYKKPGKIDEKVTASRVSGLKDPIFIFLISQFQSTSFYDDLIRISDKHYVNPISKGSLNKYHFHIEDTLLRPGTSDTTYVITYQPLRNKNFDALGGLVHINTNGYAIENVIAEPASEESGISIKIRQKYELINGQHWFPVQLRTHFVLNNVEVGPMSPVGLGTSYIKDIRINPGFANKDFDNIVINTATDAYEREDHYWEQVRVAELDKKEKETYRVIDSIGEVHNLDRKLGSFKILTEGYIPLGAFSLDLDKLVHYNDYEGWYLGVGGKTNNRFSDWLTLGAHWGYGFKDKSAKWGAKANLMLYRPWELKLKLKYLDDLKETAAVTTFDKSALMQDAWLRNYLVDRFDRTEQYKASLRFRWLQYLETEFAFSKSSRNPKYPYNFKFRETQSVHNSHNFTELSTSFRFAYGETFIKNGKSKISLGTDYPVLWFKYTRGIDNFLDGEYEFNRYDAQVDYSHYFKLFGETSLQINAGYIDGNIPATNLYNGHGSYRKFSVFAPTSFSTMRMNEFLSDRYISMYFTHNFGKLLFRTTHFAPDIMIATHMGFGTIDDFKDHHFDFTPKTMDKGYYESGLLLNNLLGSGITGIGIGAFYRYGPYRLDGFSKNISLKLSLSFTF